MGILHKLHAFLLNFFYFAGERLEPDGTLIKKSDPQRAERHLRKAIAIDPRFSKAFYRLGLLLKEQEKFADAYDQLERAIEINPKFAKAHFHMAELLMDEKAAKALSRAKRSTEGSSANGRKPPASKRRRTVAKRATTRKKAG